MFTCARRVLRAHVDMVDVRTSTEKKINLRDDRNGPPYEAALLCICMLRTEVLMYSHIWSSRATPVNLSLIHI